MIKLIASDMDGTLLNDKMQVSDENAAAIRQAGENGIEFMVATGRGLTEAKPLLADQQLHPAFITLNGAMVYDEAGNLVVSIPLADDMTAYSMRTLDERNIYYELVTDHGIFSNSRVRRIQNVADLLVNLNPDTNYKLAVALASARLEIMNINYVPNYTDVLADPEVHVMKIIAFNTASPEDLKEPKELLMATGKLMVTSSSVNNIEINNIDAQKGIALTKYAQQKGFDMDSVMSIGDNYNDESMIRDAKYSVAMGNAIDPIKDLAWFITATNTNHGVALAIMQALAENRREQKSAKTEFDN
ncbi:Cof-type HAD-IIB family hydrolase [Lacticaseibacillus sharpeae]|uniref:HAD superfamily hydrolase n=1 Tax=Lacticaseibacillus sharpeae JCM 1186 = DSM 20505 TaxID=1291052 RepID=A0A0R1ZNJ4_9LACO|nr:Cof-type HAD-IIB family hydrolase [Lacticaseibacillus sharpeae]KRM54708.1 HAD superfamily hydrolase [Lacticaseibacillus sharpeae JCM 1186 = DSM 20505]